MHKIISVLIVVFTYFLTTSVSLAQDQQTIHIGVPSVLNGSAPEQENITNFITDYWTKWAKRNHYEPVLIEGTLKQLTDKLKNGEIDFVTTVTSSVQSSDQFLVSLPYVSLVGALYENINEKTDRKIALNLPPNVLPAYFDRNDDVILHSYDVSKISRVLNDVDYLYTVKIDEVKSELERLGLTEKFVLSNELDPGIKISAITSKNNTSLIRKINYSIIHDDFSSLLNDWYDFFKQGSSYYSLLIGTYDKNLSPKQLATLAQIPTLTFPYIKKGNEPDFTSDGFFIDGYLVNILKKISKKIGFNFQPVGYESFESAFSALKQKEVDFFPGLFQTNERSFLAFTQPIGDNIAAIASIKGFSSKDSLTDLRIAVVEGFAENDILKASLDFTAVTYPTLQEAILSVSEGTTDAFVGNIFNVAYQVSAQDLHNLHVLRAENFHFNMPIKIGLQKKHQNAVSLFNYALFSLGSDLQTEAQDRWKRQANSIHISSELDRVTKQYTLYVLIGAAVLFAAFMLYRRSVRNKLQLASALESALQKAEVEQQKAERLATAKSDFLARMSHEIRTPMNGVLGMAEALTFTELNKQQKGLLNSLNGAANSLLALLNDVLDFSKMEAGKLTIEEVTSDLAAMLAQVRENVIITASDKGLDIDVVISPSVSKHYFCDTTRLMQVLNNLVSNAIKFTEQGKVTIEISLINESERSDTLAFYIRDTGIGISEQALPQLFSPFTQAESSITRKYGGTGLGLSICKEIVDAMGGSISVASIPNSGTQFKTVLTLRKATQEDLSESRLTNMSEATSTVDISNLSILLVEDNELNRQVISGQLTKLNIDHDMAVNGRDALDKCQSNQYDIVLSDCHMPVMDGFELANTLSEKSDRPYLIALTADVLSGSSQKCFDAGFDDYLSKPCPIDILHHKLSITVPLLGKTAPRIENSSDENKTNLEESFDDTQFTSEPALDNHIDVLDDLVSDFLPDEASSSPEFSPSLMQHEAISTLMNKVKEIQEFAPDYVIEICGNDETMAKTILKSFLENIDAERQRLQPPLQTKQEYKNAFHKLKGSFLYLGISEPGELSTILEEQAFDFNMEELAVGLSTLNQYMTVLARNIEEYIDHEN